MLFSLISREYSIDFYGSICVGYDKINSLSITLATTGFNNS